PVTSTLQRVGATSRICSYTRRIGALLPIMPAKSLSRDDVACSADSNKAIPLRVGAPGATERAAIACHRTSIGLPPSRSVASCFVLSVRSSQVATGNQALQQDHFGPGD